MIDTTPGAAAWPHSPGAPDPVGQAAEVTRPARGGEDFQTFLRMLTVQMQNQDPMNPMQATEFAQQLATFSGVEQQVRSNALLARLLERADMADMAAWVGAQVRSPSGAQFDGATPVEMTLQPPADPPGRATLVVRDAMGVQVASDQVDPAAPRHLWRGLGADGMPLPPGRYTFELLGHDDGGPFPLPTPETFARVIEVQRNADGLTLSLEGGATVPAQGVSALRAGQP